MKVNILYSGVFPSFCAGAKRIGLYQKGLIEEGVDVQIYTPITRFYTWPFLVVMVINPLWVFLYSLKHFTKGSIVFVYGFNWTSLSFLIVSSVLKKFKVVIEVNEKPNTAYGNRFTEIRLVKSINRFCLLKLVYPMLDGFVVISEALTNFVKAHVSHPNLIKIPIIVNLAELNRQIKLVHVHKPFMFHAGAMSERKDGILGVLKAFAIVNETRTEKLHFYLTNKVAPVHILDEFYDIVNKHNLINYVHFVEKLPEDVLLAYQKQCAFAVINKEPNEQNLHNFPTKLGEFLALGKPVIATPVGEMSKFLVDKKNALIVPYGDHEILAEKMGELLDNYISSKELAEGALKLAKNCFDYQIQTRKMKEFFYSLF